MIKRSRRAQLLCPGDDIEDNGPLFISSRHTANDENGKLLFTGAQPGQNSEGLVDLLLRPDGFAD
jgi:hypothetical protein